MSKKTGFFEQAGIFLDRSIWGLFSLIGVILLSVPSVIADTCSNYSNNGSEGLHLCFFIPDNPWGIIGLAAFFLVIGRIGGYRYKRKLKKTNKTLKKENAIIPKLKKEIDGSQEREQELVAELKEMHKKLIMTWLMGAIKQLELCTNTRITIYYERDEDFYLLARRSSNPALSKENRIKFPLNKGVISQTWQHGEHVNFDIPEFDEKNPELYISCIMETYGYTKEDVINLNMKSCRYYGIAIEDEGSNVGVILFESTNTDTLNYAKKQEIKSFCLENGHQSYLSGFVRKGLQLDKSAATPPMNKYFSTETEFMSTLKGGKNE